MEEKCQYKSTNTQNNKNSEKEKGIEIKNIFEDIWKMNLKFLKTSD